MKFPTDTVFLEQTHGAEYPLPPFHPPEIYPEIASFLPHKTDSHNTIYTAVRNIFRSFQFDQAREGTAEWNPLKDFIIPGNRVIIKPNLVFHKHPLGKRGVNSMITHGSVIRPIIDYAWKALKGNGEIVICDVPLQTADWDTMMESTGLASMVAYLSNQRVHIKLLDLRLEHAIQNRYGVITKRIQWDGDPQGYIAVDLGKESALTPITTHYQCLTITDYPQQVVSEHHNQNKNEYLIAKTILAADVFINVPKLKTHKKAGVTLSLKNLIGINGDKSWIAHHREGTPTQGGDETPHTNIWDSLRYKVFVGLKYRRWGIPLLSFLLYILHAISKTQSQFLKRTGRSGLLKFRSITEGSWYGNDTLWRVILDLNRILRYADRSGVMRTEQQRRYLAIIDGVLGGEGEGPMHQSPVDARVLVAGFNPVAIDTVAAALMGFDFERIPQIARAYEQHALPLTSCTSGEISVHEVGQGPHPFVGWQPREPLAFFSPTTWRGHVELPRTIVALANRPEPTLSGSIGGE